MTVHSSVRSCAHQGKGQVCHVCVWLRADEGEHELARSGFPVAPRLEERVLRGAGDRKSFDEACVEHNRRRFTRAQAIDCGGEVGLRQVPCPQQRRLCRRHPLAERPKSRQHLGDRRLGQGMSLRAVGPHRAWNVLHDLGGRRSLRGLCRLADHVDRLSGKTRRAHVRDHQPVGDRSAQRERLLASGRHEQRHIRSQRLVFQFDLVRGEHPPVIVHLFAFEQGAHDRDRVAHGRERTIGAQSHALGGGRDARSDPQPRPALRQFVERADLHRHQRGVAVVGVEHPDADAQPARGRGAGRRRRQHAAIERVLREPDGIKAPGLGRLCERDATAWIDPAVETHAQFRQIAHIRPFEQRFPRRMTARPIRRRDARRRSPRKNGYERRATRRPPCETPWWSG